MAEVTNEILAAMITALDGKVDDLNKKVDIQNGRTFGNSTDIAKMKGIGAAFAFILSILSVIGVYLGLKR